MASNADHSVKIQSLNYPFYNISVFYISFLLDVNEFRGLSVSLSPRDCVRPVLKPVMNISVIFKLKTILVISVTDSR